ncbi:response regulator [Paenibacillus cymbidii]|uniref:response regulator n=1 Tax=Paenibacillus cymbidii TaxID=1639034 RepID=UPI001F24C6BC|nr:response regulator [Paenibacillus cymbidii]
MKAILVDDEMLALRDLERQLQKIGGIEVADKFQDGASALEAAPGIQPDVVFLDIDMPEMNGVELAERIQELLPRTEIVFVTAYEEFAVKAFELNAIDYVLKPVHSERLVRTIARLSSRKEAADEEDTPEDKPTLIRCFQCLQIDFAEPESIPWRTSKSQELFAYLIHRRTQPVRKDALLDLLWPEADLKRGYTQLYTAIYQIRKTLTARGIDIQIGNHEKGYLLHLNGLKLDVDEWERGLQQAPPLTADTLAQHMALVDLYRGDYLAEYDYLWAEGERERLRRAWLGHTMQVGKFLTETRALSEAVALYGRMKRLLPHAEQVYFALMETYHKLDDSVAVVREYTSLCDMLDTEFGTKPPAQIEAWYREWKQNSGR